MSIKRKQLLLLNEGSQENVTEKTCLPCGGVLSPWSLFSTSLMILVGLCYPSWIWN